MPIPFAYRLIELTCSCGRKANSVDKIGVTSNYDLYTVWECACGRECQVVLPLEHLTEMAPPAPMPVNAINSFDEDFLKKAHIRLE